eukprot:350621-Chlamydomonas_euryale.AAC.8
MCTGMRSARSAPSTILHCRLAMACVLAASQVCAALPGAESVGWGAGSRRGRWLQFRVLSSLVSDLG